jgi:hypothetical protein
MQRVFASVVICLLLMTAAQAQTFTEEFESPADLATRWSVTRPLDANAAVEDGKLILSHDYDMRFRHGASLSTNEPINLTTDHLVYLMKVGAYDHGTSTKKDLFNAFNFTLGDKLVQLNVNRSINKDVVRFYIDGKKVWDSYPYDRDRLFAPDSYIGFEVEGNQWKVICTDDPQNQTPMRSGEKNASQGKLDTPVKLRGKQTLRIEASNVHGHKAQWSIDRIVIEP